MGDYKPEMELEAEEYLGKAEDHLSRDCYLEAIESLNKGIALYEKQLGERDSQAFPIYQRLISLRSETRETIDRWTNQDPAD